MDLEALDLAGPPVVGEKLYFIGYSRTSDQKHAIVCQGVTILTFNDYCVKLSSGFAGGSSGGAYQRPVYDKQGNFQRCEVVCINYGTDEDLKGIGIRVDTDARIWNSKCCDSARLKTMASDSILARKESHYQEKSEKFIRIFGNFCAAGMQSMPIKNALGFPHGMLGAQTKERIPILIPQAAEMCMQTKTTLSIQLSDIEKESD